MLRLLTGLPRKMQRYSISCGNATKLITAIVISRLRAQKHIIIKERINYSQQELYILWHSNGIQVDLNFIL